MRDPSIRDALGAPPASWRGYIPLQLPRTSNALRHVVTALCIAYTGFILAMILTPTAALEEERAAMRAFSIDDTDRILVSTTGDPFTADIMRWVFLGRRDALASCLHSGQVLTFETHFERGKIVVDTPLPCVQDALSATTVKRSLRGRHRVTLTNVWLKAARLPSVPTRASF